MKPTPEYWSFGAAPIEIHVGVGSFASAVIHIPAWPW
jgi:hypothetical protein